jgi:hypothetical protein
VAAVKHEAKQPSSHTGEVVIRMPLRLGTPAFLFYKKRPLVSIRALNIFANPLSLDFVLVGSLTASNIGLITQDLAMDACAFLNENELFSIPTMTPYDAFGFVGYYTGLVPYGYKKDSIFEFTFTFRGEALNEIPSGLRKIIRKIRAR